MAIRDIRQFWSGMLFLLIGLAALWMVPRPLGQLSAMGPGYFPMLLGVGLVLLGLAAMALALRTSIRTRMEHFPLLPTCFVLGGVVAVGALIAEAGLAVSLFALVAASCYARLVRHPLEVLAVYLVLLPVTWVIFIYAVQLPITLF